jgi:hypothetical protein
MRTEERWIEADHCQPLGEQPGILTCRQMAVLPLPSEEMVARHRLRRCQKILDRLAGLFSDLEPDRSDRRALTDRRAIDHITTGSNIFDHNADEVTAAQLAIDRKIEQRQVSYPPSDLKSRSDSPDVLRLERRLCSSELSLFSKLAVKNFLTVVLDIHGSFSFHKRMSSFHDAIR